MEPKYLHLIPANVDASIEATTVFGSNLGWGFGTHACVGMHLSKLEMEALLKEMVQRVGTITVSDPQRLINNGLQGLKSFRVTFR